MPAFGNTKPTVYILGEAPGADEDIKGRQFVGKAGALLRQNIPHSFDADTLRWNNVIRCRPPGSRDPKPVEVECCRPSVIADIERTKPAAIFAFGNFALNWATGSSGIMLWAGRRIPVKIGKHACWLFAFPHPESLLEARMVDQFGRDKKSDFEFAFIKDIRRAFRAVGAGLEAPVVHDEEYAKRNIEFVSDVPRIVELLEIVANDPSCGIDLETDSLRPYHPSSRILTAAFSGRKDTFAFGLDHPEARWTESERKQIRQAIRNFLLNAKARKISFGLPFELEWLAKKIDRRILYAGRWEDAQSQAYIIDERQGALSLDFLVKQYFGFSMKAITNVDRLRLAETPLETVLLYNGIDARYHRLLFMKQRERIKREGLTAVYEHQLRRCPAAVSVQLKGVPIDHKVTKRLITKYEKVQRDVEDKIQAHPDAQRFMQTRKHHYRPSSTHDAQHMFNIQGSVQESVLAKVKHRLAGQTLAWRKAHKILSTYLYPCLPSGDASVLHADGMLHPVLALNRTRTWRTSAEDLNIQNWPKRNTDTKEVRGQVTKENERVVSFDYSGIQARNIAMESLDPTFVKSFWDHYDIHSSWARTIAELHPKWVKEGRGALDDKEVFDKYRYKAKNGFVFPSFFGAGPHSVHIALGIPFEVAQKLKLKLFSMFPNIEKWQNQIRRDFKTHAYVTGLSGFRRHAPIAATEVINAPIQADESIIVLSAMCELCEIGEDRFVPNMEVHDDLTFIWPVKDIERNAEIVLQKMLLVDLEWAHTVPIEVEYSVGKAWDKQDKIGAFETTREKTIREVKKG